MLMGLSCLANNDDALRYSLVPSERMLIPFKKIRAFISGNTYKLYAGNTHKSECVGSITDQRNTMSINNTEYNRLASALGAANASTAEDPAKFYVAVPLSKLSSRNPYQAITLLSGVSAASTPINVLVNIGTATAGGINSQLIAQYDVLTEIDPMSRSVRVIQ